MRAVLLAPAAQDVRDEDTCYADAPHTEDCPSGKLEIRERIIRPIAQVVQYYADQLGADDCGQELSLIHISEPTRPVCSSRMPSSA